MRERDEGWRMENGKKRTGEGGVWVGLIDGHTETRRESCMPGKEILT